MQRINRSTFLMIVALTVSAIFFFWNRNADQSQGAAGGHAAGCGGYHHGHILNPTQAKNPNRHDASQLPRQDIGWMA